MACSATSTTAALISSNPRAFSPKSKLISQSLSLPNSFTGLNAPLFSHVTRSVFLSRASHSRKSFIVNASSDLPLVGNIAPDFEAEVVIDQEFVKFSHLAWVQIDRKSGGLGDSKYPLISDVTKTISKSYGVLIPDQFFSMAIMGICSWLAGLSPKRVKFERTAEGL